MGKHFFDFEDGDFAFTISDNIAMDSDGNMMMRILCIYCGRNNVFEHCYIWVCHNFLPLS